MADTTPTPTDLPAALRQADAYAEARHAHGSHTYNAKTAEARNALRAAISAAAPAVAPQAGAESYPPMPEPGRRIPMGDWTNLAEVLCFTTEQMRAFADATAALRARGAVPSDAELDALIATKLVHRDQDRIFYRSFARAVLARWGAAPAAPMSVQAPSDADGFGSAEHWKEKAQYWAGVAHDLRQQALRGEPVDGIVHPPAALPGEQDAARYQALRDVGNQLHEDDICVSDSAFATYFGDELDAAVDALIERRASFDAAAKGRTDRGEA